MRLDHIAYRVPQGKRDEVAKFFMEAFGYAYQDSFPLEFDDGTSAQCVALEPPEKKKDSLWKYWSYTEYYGCSPDIPNCWIVNTGEVLTIPNTEYHLAPELFISEGDPGSIVDNWVKSRGGYGGIHHLAYQVDDVAAKMAEWKEKGWAEFSSEKPLTCPGLEQVFTVPNHTGVVYEFIHREGPGFCKENVKALMQSTKRD
ncbi:hypothetical protein C4577_01770 [Candidatus Parcubacteria bacterium]|nr:MAG: hypothetical protein C4577_01770 [Candidatus Parcubacteria bacterium]